MGSLHFALQTANDTALQSFTCVLAQKLCTTSMSSKNLSFQQYRSIDLTIWFVISCAFEYIVTISATKWFDQYVYYSVTLTFAFVSLMLMRWDARAVWTALGCGLCHCMAVGASWQMYLTVCVGNVFSLLALLLYKVVDKRKICASGLLTTVYVLVVFAVIYLGRTLVGVILGVNVNELFKAIMYDMFSAIFAVIIILICRKQNGLFEDQHQYVVRINKQEDKNKDLQQ